MKTSKTAAKRFKISGSGKVKVKKAFARHILTKKTPKRKRNLSQANYLSKADSATVKKLLPYA